MKKILLSLGLSISVMCNAFAHDNAISKLNARLVDLLAPFQNQSTQAKLTFTEIETDSKHAVKAGINVFFSKTGANNQLKIKLENLSYHFNDGNAPQIALKGSAGLDLTKLASQEALNIWFAKSVDELKDLAEDYTEDFGDAVTINGIATSINKDTKGNYTSISALISAKIDLDKLPEGKQVEDVIATEAVVSLTIHAQKGLKINAYVLANPQYSAFQDGEQGLKEVLDKLLDNDREQMAIVKEIVEQFDYLAEALLSHEPSYLFTLTKLWS